ncbi:hypothetical protein ACFLTD_03460 [Elusimicrobiota bacterium]
MSEKKYFLLLVAVFFVVGINLTSRQAYCQNDVVQSGSENSDVPDFSQTADDKQKKSGSSVTDMSDMNEYVRAGDEFNTQFNHKKSLENYLKANELFEDNYEVLWKLSRTFERLGYNSVDDTAIEINYEKAMEYAQKATAINPDGYEGHFRLAAASGRMALLKGGKTKVRLSKDVKKHCEISIELNSEYHLPYHTLSRWHHNVANLSWVLKAFAKIIYGGIPKASDDKAVSYMKKAILLKPDYINHHLQIGKIYMDMKDYEFAAEEFNKSLQLPAVEEDDEEHKAEAGELLEIVKKKLD